MYLYMQIHMRYHIEMAFPALVAPPPPLHSSFYFSFFSLEVDRVRCLVPRAVKPLYIYIFIHIIYMYIYIYIYYVLCHAQ